MFVHIGNNIILRQEDIIGVYNIKAIRNTNEYINIINKLTKEKKLMKKEDSEENTLIITEKNKTIKGYQILPLDKNITQSSHRFRQAAFIHIRII